MTRKVKENIDAQGNWTAREKHISFIVDTSPNG